MTETSNAPVEVIDEPTAASGRAEIEVHSPPQPVLLGGSPAEQLDTVREIGETLGGFIRSQGLARRLSRNTDAREYVQVEGWQFLGSMLGLTVTIEWCRKTDDHRPPTFRTEQRRNRSTGATYDVRVLDEWGAGGWEARANVVRMADDKEIAAAEMECLWTEKNWADRDSYALRSMAETRAVSKALRLPLAFIMVAAGFAATPAEEMDGVSPGGSDDPSEGDDLGPKCPHCGSALWDNRATNEEREAQGKRPMPSWKCKNASGCGGAVDRDGKPGPWISWRADEFKDWTNYVKAYAVHVLGGEGALNGDGAPPARDESQQWAARYVNAEVDETRAEVIASVIENPTPVGMAGVLWTELLEHLGRTGEEHVTREDRDRLTTWIDVMLEHPLIAETDELRMSVDMKLADATEEPTTDVDGADFYGGYS